MNQGDAYWRRAMTRRVTRRSVIVGGLGLAAAATFGCSSSGGATTPGVGSGSSPKPTPRAGGELTMSMWSKLSSLDAHMQVTSQDFYYSYPLYDNLVAPDAHFTPPGRPEVSLATSWDVTENAITFKLRTGVKFHDGTDFDARAVKFNIERQLDPKSNARTGADIRGIDSVDVVDDQTVRFNLREVRGSLINFIQRFNGQIQSPAAIQKYGAEYGLHPVGAGPFQLDEYVEASYVRYKRFDNYWIKGLPYVNRYTIEIQPERHAAWAALRNGEVDGVFEADYKDASDAKKDNRFLVYEADRIPCQLILNHKKKPFDDVRVRRAISYAIDRETAIKTLFFGFGSPATQPVNPECWGYNPNIKGYGYDPNKAKALLAEAGYANGFEAVEPIVQGADTTPNEAIGAMLAKVGIKLSFETLSTSQVLDRRDSGNFTMTYGVWGAVADPDSFYVRRYRSGGSYFYNRWDRPDVDKLIDEAAASYDLAKRKPLYQRLSQQAADEAWEVYLWDVPRPTIVGKHVRGYDAGMVGSYWQPRDTWVIK